MAPEKVNNVTDPALRAHDGVDRIRWVAFQGGDVFPRRGGKGVSLWGRYGAANANSSTLAGFVETDAAGITGGHPADVTSGHLMPVNFGEDKTFVFPTSNRAAVATDIGRAFDIVVPDPVTNHTQHVNMTATTLGVLTVQSIIDKDGKYVSVRITPGKRYGNI